MMDGQGRTDRAVSEHYGGADFVAIIERALRATGADMDALTPDDLAPVDQFHTRGKEATLDLAARLGLQGGERIVDVGGGMGGPARLVAATYGCDVTVLDLSEAFCRTGERLTELTRLTDRVHFRVGSGYDMPFDDGSFDVAWTQHATMNMEDKERLYSEIRRVLRPGGSLGFHEIMAGPEQPIHFPVPWAGDPSISFLRTPEAVRDLLRQGGFVERAWSDVTAPSLDWFRARAAPDWFASDPRSALRRVVPHAPPQFGGRTRSRH